MTVPDYQNKEEVHIPFKETSHPAEYREPPQFLEIGQKFDNLHKTVHEKMKKGLNETVLGKIPLVGPLLKEGLHLESAMVAVQRGVDLDTGEKLVTAKDRITNAAKHLGKGMWEHGKAQLEVGSAFLTASQLSGIQKELIALKDNKEKLNFKKLIDILFHKSITNSKLDTTIHGAQAGVEVAEQVIPKET